jgi:hypothetical protein
MTTLAPAPFRDILKEGPRRVLQIPPPAGHLEKVVADAVAALAKKYAHDLAKAEATIEKYGLTIEVTRLRDRLARAASTDLQRLLLSTPGVPEALFNAAIEQQLEQEEKEEGSDEASTDRLAKSLSAVDRNSKRFEHSSEGIVETLGKIVDALEDLKKNGGSGRGDPKRAAPTAKKASPAKEAPAPSPQSVPEGGSTS